MMSEELDFEAETPVADSCKLLSATKCSSQVIVKKEPVDEATTDTGVTKNSKLLSATKCCSQAIVKKEPVDEVTIDTGGTNKIYNKITFNTEEGKCEPGGVEPDTGGAEIDDEEKKSDSGEIEYDTGGAKIDDEEKKSDIIGSEIDDEKKKSDTEEVESDTGEILSDTGELSNDDQGDLEDGELDEDIAVPNKAPEVVCRYYQRGTCLYGSECRNSHVSNMVYNMFSPDLPNKGNFKPFEFPSFYRPPLFHPNIMPMVTEVESPWERGIKKAKIIMQKSQRVSEDLELENDWERCLEEAKANIENASSKRKSFQSEKPYFEPKYSKQEKFREKSPLKREESPKQKYSKNFYSKYENESNYKKTKPCGNESTHDPFKWVDPWQRSKSPKKRTRSMSFSVSPSQSPRHSRERSVSSSSSSSSYFEQIYRGKDEDKSLEKRSTSHSASPTSKKSQDFKAQVYGKKRSYSRSVSRSFSKSPKKRRYSRSLSSGYSGNSNSRKKTYNEKRHNENTFKRADSRNQVQYTSKERTTDVPLPPGIKSSYSKTGRKFSSRSKSRSTSPLSSLSCTSISTLSDTDFLETTSSRTKEDRVIKGSVRLEKKAKEPFKTNQANREHKRSTSSAFCRRSEELDHFKPKKYSPDRPKLSTSALTTTKPKSNNNKTSGSHSTTSNPASKPTASKKVIEKPSAEAMELLRYHSFAQANNKANSSNAVTKPPEPKTTLPISDTKSKNNDVSKVPINKEVASSKTTSDVQSKSQTIKSNTSVKNVKQEVLSKRKMLLQQLKAIEDAIARKKLPAQ